MICVNSQYSEMGSTLGGSPQMELVPKEQIRQYIEECNLKDLSDVQAMIKDLFASTMQEMFEAEMDTHLGYAKHDMKDKQTGNSRNGHGRKSVESELCTIESASPPGSPERIRVTAIDRQRAPKAHALH